VLEQIAGRVGRTD